jgi:hypothetical protein
MASFILSLAPQAWWPLTTYLELPVLLTTPGIWPSALQASGSMGIPPGHGGQAWILKMAQAWDSAMSQPHGCCLLSGPTVPTRLLQLSPPAGWLHNFTVLLCDKRRHTSFQSTQTHSLQERHRIPSSIQPHWLLRATCAPWRSLGSKAHQASTGVSYHCILNADEPTRIPGLMGTDM